MGTGNDAADRLGSSISTIELSAFYFESAITGNIFWRYHNHEKSCRNYGK